jgi:hypothetical protein
MVQLVISRQSYACAPTLTRLSVQQGKDISHRFSVSGFSCGVQK